MKTNYQSTHWYSCVFLTEEKCFKGFNRYSGLPTDQWVWACRRSVGAGEGGHTKEGGRARRLSDPRTGKSERP